MSVPAVVAGCPNCGHTPLTETVWHEAAIVRAGGYGATRTTTITWCPACDTIAGHTITDTRPDPA